MSESRDIARQDRGPVIDDLLASCAALRAENAALREDMVRSSEDMGRICAENAALRKALEPFGKFADQYDNGKWQDHETHWALTYDFDFTLSVGDLRRARAALTRKPVPAP